MAQAEGDDSMMREIASDAAGLRAKLSEMRLRLMMSGEHDGRDAILSIYAGAGGTESQDWTEMLLRMYLRWAGRRGLASEIIDQSEGDEAGLKSATIEIKGPNAYGYLRSERGVHRLVRISPFDNAHRRHTSFALVEVIPDVANAIKIEINPDDVKLEVFGASGHGGQSVQKNATAVRITHLPTAIVAVCQDERSQLKNRNKAMAVLRARILDIERRKQQEEVESTRRSQVGTGERAEKIRTYNFPQDRVTDHRIGYTRHNLPALLDGELDDIIAAMQEDEQARLLEAQLA